VLWRRKRILSLGDSQTIQTVPLHFTANSHFNAGHLKSTHKGFNMTEYHGKAEWETKCDSPHGVMRPAAGNWAPELRLRVLARWLLLRNFFQNLLIIVVDIKRAQTSSGTQLVSHRAPAARRLVKRKKKKNNRPHIWSSDTFSWRNNRWGVINDQSQPGGNRSL